MDNALAQILPAGNLRLLPGVSYRVVRQFTDEDGQLHQVGEQWRFNGYEERRLAGGYTLHCSSLDGVERKIRLNQRKLVSDPLLPLDHFEHYVVGPDVEVTKLIAKLSVDSRNAFQRLEERLKPLPSTSSGLIRRLDEIRPHSKGEEDGPSQCTADVWALQHEIYRLLRDVSSREDR